MNHKIAILSDIHGNATALEAVIAATKIKEASVAEIVEVGVPRAVAEAVQRKLNPQEAEALPQVAEERVDYQTEGNHNEP